MMEIRVFTPQPPQLENRFIHEIWSIRKVTGLLMYLYFQAERIEEEKELLMSVEFSQEEQAAKDLAIASLAVSVSCIFMTLGLFAFIGSIIGHKAMGKLNAVGNVSHKGFATAGIIVGYVATALAWLTIIIFIFGAFVLYGF
jgi:hypothetical protein